ncbi:hypothetical protein K0M31_001663, partial [Melipona bicolor]
CIFGANYSRTILCNYKVQKQQLVCLIVLQRFSVPFTATLLLSRQARQRRKTRGSKGQEVSTRFLLPKIISARRLRNLGSRECDGRSRSGLEVDQKGPEGGKMIGEFRFVRPLAHANASNVSNDCVTGSTDLAHLASLARLLFAGLSVLADSPRPA